MRKNSIAATSLVALLLAACGSSLNWREYTSKDASFQALFPAKPVTHTREVDLDGAKVNMTMTAAEVDETLFAVGSADAGDPATAAKALGTMQAALVRNIDATVSKSKASASPGISKLDVEASGSRNGRPVRMVGHFEARGQRIYQVIVAGPAASVKPEVSEQFITSFKAL